MTAVTRIPAGARHCEELVCGLEGRRAEIEQAILTRVYAVSDSIGVADPPYLDGLRAAVSAALTYAIAALETGGGRPAPVPVPLLSQARRAARDGIPLDTVLRRYLAGHVLLEDFIVQEMERAGENLPGATLQGALRREAATLDHLLDAVAGEYRAEVEAKARSLHRRRAECIDRLLADDLADPDELGYDLELWHIGAIAVGKEAEQAIRALARRLDFRLLLVPRGEGTLWTWLGSLRKPGGDDLERLARWQWPGGVFVAAGEPAFGFAGWRLTHEQASAAFPIAMREERSHVRYVDVALLASMLKDDVLVRSLAELYLDPLAPGASGEEALRQTLRTYFSTQRNVSSTASALGVSRKTVNSRLRTAEQRLGRTLDTCAAELELALRFERLGAEIGVTQRRKPTVNA